MSEHRPTVLFVEDAPDVRDIARIFLNKSGYDVVEKEDAESAWEYLQNNHQHVDVALLDILLPGFDGYELCSRIKSHDQMKDLPVVFASSLTDLEEKLKGYACGGDDYVTKPVLYEELQQKIKRILQIKNTTVELKQRASASTSAALEAMNYSSDLGQIISFYKASLDVQNYQELAQKVFEVTNNLELRTCMTFFVEGDALSYSSNGKVTPLEINIMEMTRGGKRFVDFGQRTIITHKNFTLLIKNMPVDRPSRYGVLKDTLGALGDALEARVHSLQQNNLENKRNELINFVQLSTLEAESTFEQIYTEINSAMETMNSAVEDAFISIGLTEQQEQHFRDIVKALIAQSESAMAKGDRLLSAFDQISSALRKSLSIKSGS
ncbi:MAG: response regulator [Gammaproteobacteria bacterium]|nr:response regulator [Gammaproteobacteria bacterium]